MDSLQQQGVILHQFLSGTEVPYASKDLVAARDNYQRFLTLVEEALSAFLAGNINQFDPQVGTTSCQAFALMFAEMAGDSSLKAEVRQLLPQITMAQQQVGELVFPKMGKVSVVSLLGSDKVITVSERVYAIALGYVLTLARKSLKEEHRSDPQALLRYGFTKQGAAKVVDTAKRALSAYSVSYVQQLAHHLSSDLRGRLSDQFVRADAKGIKCQPFFALTEAVVQNVSRCGVPLRLNVQRGNETVTVDYLFDGTNYRPSNNPLPLGATVFRIDAEQASDADEPANVYLDRLLQHDILDLVRYGAAPHSQFPATYKGEELPEDLKLERYAKLGRELGCVPDNKSLCCIRHVFADTVVS